MKQFGFGLLLTVTLSALVGFGFVQVQAVDDGPVVLTESQIETVRNRCLASKVVLDKLHSTDALLRVNLGQQYENISSRLMAPLNSRVALNAYDGVALTKTTVEFNQALDQFRNQYRWYESSVDSALNVDCTMQPVEYYAAIENARQRRADLHEATRRVNKLTQEYLDEFDVFATKFMKEQAD